MTNPIPPPAAIPASNRAKRLRLVHFIHHDGPGGGPHSVARQIEYFQRDYEVVVIHGGRGEVVRMCERYGIPHRQLPVDRFWKLLWGFPRLILALLKIRPDILVLHGQWAGPVGAVAGRLARVPHLVYVARWPAFYTNWDLCRSIRNDMAERIPCRMADVIVALSHSTRYRYLYRRMADEKKIVVIPNPLERAVIPSSEEIQSLRRRLGWSENECHVVSVGRLATQKQVDWLLRSWRLVLDSGISNARLWIVGDGETKEELLRLHQSLGLGQSCVFLGAQPNGAHYIGAADIVAMTSMYESFGNVVLEAFASGRPLVASAVDGIRDTLTDGTQGYLAPPGHIALFAERLLSLIRDKSLRARLGEEGRKTAAHYESSRIFTQYRDLFDGLAGTGGSA